MLQTITKEMVYLKKASFGKFNLSILMKFLVERTMMRYSKVLPYASFKDKLYATHTNYCCCQSSNFVSYDY